MSARVISAGERGDALSPCVGSCHLLARPPSTDGALRPAAGAPSGGEWGAVRAPKQRTGPLVVVTGCHEPASWRLRWADDLGRHEPTHGRLEERTGVSSTADGVGVRRSGAVACWLLALCNMRTLYLRNVPDDVVRRLERLAARDGTSVGAVAVRELADVTRRADNPSLLGLLPDLDVDVTTIVADLSGEREQR